MKNKIISVILLCAVVLSQLFITAYADEASYYPVNVIVSKRNEFLGISWLNPVSGIIKDIKLTDAKSGEILPYTGTITKEAGKLNIGKITGVSKTEELLIKLTFYFENHNTVEYVTYGKGTADTSMIAIDGWSRSGGDGRGDTALGFLPAEVSLDRSIKKTGNSSLKITSNIEAAANDLYLGISQNLSDYDPEKNYVVGFWFKSKNTTGNNLIIAYAGQPMNDGEAINNYFSYAPGAKKGKKRIGNMLPFL